MISVCVYLPTYQLGIGVMTLKLDIVIIVYMRIKAKGIFLHETVSLLHRSQTEEDTDNVTDSV